MKLARVDHRRTSEPIIALIDVVFFLLVFFMLVARLDATAPFDVVPPDAMTGRALPGGGVTLSIARDGVLAVDGRQVPQDEWLIAVRGSQARTAATLIRVNAHRDVALRHVLPVIDTLEATAVGEVVLVVTPPAP